MAQHRRQSRSRALSLSTAGMITAVAAGGFAAPANADEKSDLFDQIDAISEKASAKAEQLKKTEDEIAQAEKEVAALRGDAEVAKNDAQHAAEARTGAQGNVDNSALTQYRNLSSDAHINALGSKSPQEAIDRASYLRSLSNNAQRTLDEQQQLSDHAAQRATDANIAVAVADFRQSELEGKRTKLERERKELDDQIKEVEARVNALNPEQRAQWENKNNPIAVNVPASGYGNGVVGSAMSKLGAPYGWGAAGPDAFDCSGLMYWSYAQNGKSIPRTSQAQLAGGTPVPLSQLQPGDIIGYYPGITHVGMYIGDGQVVHASDYGIPVQVVPLNSMPVQGAVRY